MVKTKQFFNHPKHKEHIHFNSSIYKFLKEKNLKNEGGWGALPPKARAKAREDIARKFPTHYKNAIEEFTRKQASRTAPNK